MESAGDFAGDGCNGAAAADTFMKTENVTSSSPYFLHFLSLLSSIHFLSSRPILLILMYRIVRLFVSSCICSA